MSQKPIHLSDERYLAALKRIRGIIVRGYLSLDFNDCTDIGNKSTECSWGLCCDKHSHWPDAEDHLWPSRRNDVVVTLYRKGHHFCPFDRRMRFRNEKTNMGNGCFYTCMVFHRGSRSLPTREEAIALYDEAIRMIEEKIRKEVGVSGGVPCNA